ncbi:protein kinase domain-containing protein [Lysobacter sp. A289]
MDPEKIAHWQAADAAFGQWLDLPETETEREAWLAAQALPEPVRRRLVQLITAHERPRASLDPGGSNLAGCRLGDWTLDSELGRGGMAVVYRAWREQGMTRQKAAVKILTLGALGATGRERFRREAAILARLNHPNVTALIDSGVADDGTFWLAMPLVEGERIDRWCDANALDARAIVRLYLQVCGAAAYAHRNLVIHRDLKPSNVLVDTGGHVRLLDFGIGQFADAEVERTQTMWRALTPGYAAPEQLRGDPPSTAMDVYGLGALLHRLLTGRAPQEATEGTDTTRPSLLVRSIDDAYHRHYVPLKNDLDRVLLKALAEEPEQRYPTAEALADDLRRWLDGQPVLAQKPKLGYRVRKFVARNKGGVAAAVLLVASLGAGVGATLWQAGEARREAENANVQAQRAVLVRDFLEQVFTSTEPAVGDVPDALELLEEGSRRARSDLLANDPLAAADILILTGTARKHLSRYDLAQEDLLAALSLLEDHRVGQGAGARERVLAKRQLAEIHWNSGRLKEAVDVSEQAVAIAAANDVPEEDLLDARLSVAQATVYLDPAAAETMTRKVLEDAIAAGFSDSYLHRDILHTLGTAMSLGDGDQDELMEVVEEELRLGRLLDGEHSGWYAYRLADNSRIFLFAGKTDRATRMLEQAVAIVDEVYKQPHQLAATIHCNMAAHLHLAGELDRALTHYERSADIDRAIDRKSLSASECARYRGIIKATLGRYPSALEELEVAESLRILNDSNQSAIGRSICGMRASLHLRQGNVLQASQALEQCNARSDVGTSHIYDLAEAEVRMAQGKLEEATELAEGLRQRVKRGLDNSWMRPWMLSLLLANKTGDVEAGATLAADAAAFIDDAPPVAQCLAATTEANCLALP